MDLAGRTVLITGATDGIGRAAALALAARGADLTIVARDAGKAEALLAALRAAGAADARALIADLSRLAEVRRAAQDFEARHDRLDVLVNNAGAMFAAPRPGPDGYERTFALNHLAYFQLTTSLLGLIRRTPGARVVSTASAMHAHGRLDLATAATGLTGSGAAAYARSKLANVLFTRELQRRLADTTATATCFHPGTVRSRFGAYGHDLGPLLRLGFMLVAPFAKTPAQGAETLVWLATAPEAAGLGGAYVVGRRARSPARRARDPRLAAELWALSERLCMAAGP